MLGKEQGSDALVPYLFSLVPYWYISGTAFSLKFVCKYRTSTVLTLFLVIWYGVSTVLTGKVFSVNTYSFGYDFGNAETCGVAVVNGRKIAKCIPTALSQESGSRLSNIGVGMRPDHFIFQMEGKHAEFFVGNLALEQGSNIWNGYGDPGRYWNSKSLVALLTLSSTMIPDDEFALNVVTGIPVEAYGGGVTNRQKIKDALQGDHTFVVNNRKRVIHIHVDKVIMEGAGAAIAYGSSRGRQGVIDIGGRTTDLYASNGQTPDMKYCRGMAIGVQTAMDAINASFEKIYGASLSAQELRSLMRATIYEQRLPFAYARGEQVDMNEIVHESIDQTVESLVSFIRSKWRSSESDTIIASGFETVTIVGGGAYYFFNQIRRDIPHAICPSEPEQANAYGYWMFAEQLARRLRAVS